MGIQAFVSIAEIRARGCIKDSDVLRLRRAFHEDCVVDAEEAELLLSLNETCPIKDPAWADFLVEILTDFVVHQQKPEGYMVAEKAAWLMSRLGQSGRLRSSAEIELAVNILDKARWSPPSLVAFALDQVRRAVETGTGPLRSVTASEPGTITPGDVALIRRILKAFGGDTAIAITRCEADALLAINAAIAPGKSSPTWTDLLVRTVGNGVLSGLGRAVPSRADQLADATGGAGLIAITQLRAGENDVAPRSAASIGGYGSSAISFGSGSIWASCRPQSAEERAMARLERQRLEIVTGEPIAEADEAWLCERVLGAARLGENELALLAFLQQEANGLPPSLNERVARALIAA